MRLHRDDRAVRNVVGFTLTFSIIVVSVGLVATLGYTQLGSISQGERVENGREAMELIGTNFQQLEQQRATVQVNELDISGGELTVVEGPSVRINATRNFDRSFAVRGLEYAVGDTTFTYENGALFRTDPSGSTIMIDSPQQTCTPNRAVISLVAIDGDSDFHFGGDVVTVNGTTQSQDLIYPLNRTGTDSASDAEDVNVTVTSPRADAWASHLNASGNWTSVDGIDDKYVCRGVDSVHVRRTVISVSFLS